MIVSIILGYRSKVEAAERSQKMKIFKIIFCQQNLF